MAADTTGRHDRGRGTTNSTNGMGVVAVGKTIPAVDADGHPLLKASGRTAAVTGLCGQDIPRAPRQGDRPDEGVRHRPERHERDRGLGVQHR